MRIYVTLFVSMLATMVSAQSSSVVRRYVDSLTIARERLNTLSAEEGADAHYMRLFTPVTYHPDIVHRSFSLDEDDATIAEENATVNSALIDLYIHHPEYVHPYVLKETVEGEVVFMPKKKVETTSLDEVFDLPDVAEEEFDDIDLVIKKPNFWTLGGDFYLQFMQNYYSDNWYQGLESNYSWLAKVTLQANYNNKQKWTWENKLEMNIGLQTNRSDEVHKLKTSEDLLRYTGKVGLQATKRWYYTFQLVANTQFMRSYESNTDDVLSSFMSPFNLNASLGMSYNASCLHDKLTGSVYLSPIALNYKYCRRGELAETNGIDVGKHSLVDFGLTFTVEGTWKFNDIISWTTRLYGYTPYDRIELQWENTFNLQVTKIIAMTLYVYPRFDDSSSELKDKGYGYFQLKEYVSFGLTYSF